jgi:hypothetical protein
MKILTTQTDVNKQEIWHACLEADQSIWDIGTTQAEAIGKVFMKLSIHDNAKKTNHGPLQQSFYLKDQYCQTASVPFPEMVNTILSEKTAQPEES